MESEPQSLRRRILEEGSTMREGGILRYPEELRDLWNDAVEREGLRWLRVSTITRKNRANYIRRLVEIPEYDRWAVIIERVLANDFLLGGNKDGKVILTLLWLVKGDHAELAEAGQYGMGKPKGREKVDDGFKPSVLTKEELEALTPEMTKSEKRFEERLAREAAELVEDII